MIRVKYSHPSTPVLPIDINKIYEIEENEDKYFIRIDKENIEISFDYLSSFFKVVEGELNNKKSEIYIEGNKLNNKFKETNKQKDKNIVEDFSLEED